MIKFIAMFLLINSQIAFSFDLTKEDYYDLTSWNTDQQIFYVSGFMVGTYASAYMASLHNYLDASKLQTGQGEDVINVLRDTLLGYQRTENWETPIYMAIFRRNLDKEELNGL